MPTDYLADDYRNAMPDASNSSSLVAHPFQFAAPALVTGDTVKLTRIPGSMGIQLVGFVIDFPTGTGALVGDLGDNDTGTLFGTGLNMFATRISSFESTAGVVIGTLPKTYTADNDLVITVSTGSGDVSVTTIRGTLYYVQFGIPDTFS